MNHQPVQEAEIAKTSNGQATRDRHPGRGLGVHEANDFRRTVSGSFPPEQRGGESSTQSWESWRELLFPRCWLSQRACLTPARVFASAAAGDWWSSSSSISHAWVLARVPPRGRNYTGSSEECAHQPTPLLSKAALATSIQSNQPSQGLPSSPNPFMAIRRSGSRGLLGGEAQTRVGFAREGLWKGRDTRLFMPQ